jgi:hypothetical protein
METTSFDNKCYFIIIVNEYSHTVWTSSISSKLEVLPKVKEYIACLENVCSIKVQGVMSDNGTEFINSKMTNFLRLKGIATFTSVPYMPEQNGIAERGIWTLMEGAHMMLYAAKLPKHLWSAAIQMVTYLHNRSPTCTNNGTTPLEKLSGETLDLSHLCVFGCLVSVVIPTQKRPKWDEKSRMGYLAGYEPYSSGYLIWFPGMRKLEKACDVIFHEESVAPVTPVLYSDEEIPMAMTTCEGLVSPPAAPEVKQVVPENTRLTICILPHPKPALVTCLSLYQTSPISCPELLDQVSCGNSQELI